MSVGNSILFGNAAADDGGAIRMGPDNDPYGKFTNIAVVRNTAAASGGGLEARSTNMDTWDSLLFGNHANSLGGGASTTLGLTVSFRNTAFIDNSASADGGGLHHSATSTVYLTNVLFSGNSSSANGGGYRGFSSSGYLTNVTVVDNTASGDGAGINLSSSANPTIVNGVLAGNGEDDIFTSSSTPVITNTCAEQDLESYDEANVDLSADPFSSGKPNGMVFLDGTNGADCIDAGSISAADNSTYGYTAFGLDDWDTLTVRASDVLDTGTVDLGMHYDPDQQTASLSTTETAAQWSAIGATRCVLFNDADASVIEIDLGGGMNGSVAHGQEQDVQLTLVCLGTGLPVVAEDTVPGEG